MTRSKPQPCRTPGCGLVYTPGYFAEHVKGYHNGHSFDDEAGYDEVQPRCDLCGQPQWLTGDDWNGETGNHLSCEAQANARLRLRDDARRREQGIMR